MTKQLTGGCVCGAIRFAMADTFQHFYFCFCEQCRRMTGSAHASHLFTAADNITWLKGQEALRSYRHPSRDFAQVFCMHCGSGLPHLSLDGQHLVVPAGCLDTEPSQLPDAQIFYAEQPHWHQQGLLAACYNGFADHDKK